MLVSGYSKRNQKNSIFHFFIVIIVNNPIYGKSVNYDINQLLNSKLRDDLNIIARKLRIAGYRKLRKDDLISSILSCDEQDVRKTLSVTWWDRYHNHVYGAAGIVALVLTILFFVVSFTAKRPLASVLDIDTILYDDSMESKFKLRNVKDQIAFCLIKGAASVDGNPIQIIDKKFESQPLSLSPGQRLSTEGVVIRGRTFKNIVDGNLFPEIIQEIDIKYGSSEKTIGEYNTFVRAKLNIDKLKKFYKSKKSPGGVWILERSDAKE